MNQSGRYLLDTSIVVALFSEEIGVQEKIRNAGQGYLVFGFLAIFFTSVNILR